ncbi:MAG: Gfo/Idh/MocA family oxidoreductase [Eubacteriales bacterium]|nr:Gfo/Idh/MocA family oxidoreductase [Eubacteriales bacterium]
MNINFKKEERLLKVGILGCGQISQAAHLIGVTKSRNLHLQAICDASEELCSKMAAIYSPDRAYTDYEEMLADPEVEAVIIGIGDQFHVPCAKKAILAGKHVFVEKPMGVSIEECEELDQLAKENGRKLQVGHMKRYDEGISFGKKFADEKLGTPTTYKGWYCDSIGRYTLTDNVQPVICSGAGAIKPAGNPKEILDHYYLLGHGSHLFDTALYMAGPIRAVSARYVHSEKQHSWLIDCEFENGVIGNLNLIVSIAELWHEGFEYYGTKGTVFANTFNPWEFRSSEVDCFDAETQTRVRPAAFDGQFYRRELEGFADTVLYDAPYTGATAEDGIMVMKALIATYQSVQQHGAWILLKDVKGGL